LIKSRGVEEEKLLENAMKFGRNHRICGETHKSCISFQVKTREKLKQKWTEISK